MPQATSVSRLPLPAVNLTSPSPARLHRSAALVSPKMLPPAPRLWATPAGMTINVHGAYSPLGNTGHANRSSPGEDVMDRDRFHGIEGQPPSRLDFADGKGMKTDGEAGE